MLFEDLIYIVQFEQDVYLSFTSIEEIYSYIEDKCDFDDEDFQVISAHNLELNDFTLPALVNGKWDTGYLEDCRNEVGLFIKQIKQEYADSRQIIEDERFY